MISLEERKNAFIEKLKKCNSNVELVGDYITQRTPTLFFCKIHGIEWVTSPASPLQGCGCPICRQEKKSLHRRVSHKEFEKRVSKTNPGIQILTEYMGGGYPITVRCSCGNLHTFPEARALLDGQNCPKCKNKRIGDAQRKDPEKFQAEMKEKFPLIEPLEPYRGSHHKIKYRCLKCGYEHSATPTNLLTGYGCPNCCGSKGEEAVRIFLVEHNIEFEEQKWFDECRDQLPLRFDFFIPSLKLLIEYQGQQHYQRRFDWSCSNPEEAGSFETLQRHDQMKRDFCKKFGYTELEIKYTDFKNISNILKEVLLKEEVMSE